MATGRLTGIICIRCDVAEWREHDGKYRCGYCLHEEDAPPPARARDTTPCPAPVAPAVYPPGYVAGPWGWPVKLSSTCPRLAYGSLGLRRVDAGEVWGANVDAADRERAVADAHDARLADMLDRFIYSRDTRSQTGDEIVEYVASRYSFGVGGGK